MSCNKPLTAFQSLVKRPNGIRGISFSPGGNDVPIALPCGQCIGCRLDRARSWAIRLQLESQQHLDNSFVTLTYDEDHIPHGDTVVPEHLTGFVKNLRNRFRSKRFRFYGVGEYGGKFDRPHYHLILFGLAFPDAREHSRRDGIVLNRSRILESIWTEGISSVQQVTMEVAAYVAKYAVKRITGDKAFDHYSWVDEQTGELHQRHPEFARMSRRPGIGHEWLKKYYTDVYPKGYVTSKGMKFPPPEYFNKLFKKWHPEAFEALHDEKAQERFDNYMDFDWDRAAAREVIQTKNHNLRRK